MQHRTQRALRLDFYLGLGRLYYGLPPRAAGLQLGLAVHRRPEQREGAGNGRQEDSNRLLRHDGYLECSRRKSPVAFETSSEAISLGSLGQWRPACARCDGVNTVWQNLST